MWSSDRYSVLLGRLHCNRQVDGRLRREEDVKVFLMEDQALGDRIQQHVAKYERTPNSNLVEVNGFGVLTLAPVVVLTADVNNFVGFWWHSNFTSAKAAAWPSISWLTPHCLLYSCIEPLILKAEGLVLLPRDTNQNKLFLSGVARYMII